MRLSVGRALAATAIAFLLGPRATRAADLPEEFSALSAAITTSSRQLGRRLESAPATLISSTVFDQFVPAELQAQIRADLAFIQGVRGNAASPLHQRVFGPVDGSAYIQFLTSRVKSISFDASDGPGGMLYVRPFVDHITVFFTPNYERFNHPQIARLMLLFHESRHTEAAQRYWLHIHCPWPFQDGEGRDIRSIWTGELLASESACDNTALGAYGVSVIMLKNIQISCASCTDKVKMDAGLYADDQTKRVIDPAARKTLQNDLYR